ncbi:hypothetical protein CK203_006790 [Vitis vinifera]|uniref:Uncharacterized protein n=1 Tax=Vitis vinifera TaxID=29760 RepID=A0A438KCM0_VITVI|nr:hypothetical protein CK203_006790 [Vitis vinifera]
MPLISFIDTLITTAEELRVQQYSYGKHLKWLGLGWGCEGSRFCLSGSSDSMIRHANLPFNVPPVPYAVQMVVMMLVGLSVTTKFGVGWRGSSMPGTSEY